jgi:hypothetical protein
MKVHGPNLHEPIWTLMKQIESWIWTLDWTFVCILIIQIVFFVVRISLQFFQSWTLI